VNLVGWCSCACIQQVVLTRQACVCSCIVAVPKNNTKTISVHVCLRSQQSFRLLWRCLSKSFGSKCV
jgi:hypothetical protein